MRYAPAQPKANKPRAAPGRQAGYALVIMLVLLVVGSLYALVSKLNSVSLQSQQNQAAGSALQQAREALLTYATTYSDKNAGQVFGYLPCPDMDGDGDADATSSATECGASDVTVIGLLPYKTLNLPDGRDAQGNCLWYAVSGRFKAATTKTASLNWDTQGQIIVQDINGNALTQLEDAHGGVAAVVFAVGPPLAGQSRPAADPAKACQYTPSATSSSLFIDSDPSPGATPSTKTAGSSTTFKTGLPDSTTNNDGLAWITPVDIFSRVKNRKGTGTQELVQNINLLSGSITTALTNSAALPTPSSAQTSANGLLSYGGVPVTVSGNYFKNWSNQYSYVVCNGGSTRCISLCDSNGANCVGNACAGVLIFAGERTAIGPRTAAELSTVDSYLEDLNLASLRTSAAPQFTRTGAFAIGTPSNAASQDFVTCLNPQQTITGFVPPASQGSWSTPPATGTTTAAVTTTELTLTGATSSSYGCTWYPQSLAFTNGVRAYFTFKMDQPLDEGFTFSMADAGSNATPSSMCGRGAEFLGYSGSNGATNPINPPKLALEFDTKQESARNDPSFPHAAFVFWKSATDSDNVHDSSSCVSSATAPCNPVPDFDLTNLLGTTVYVRVDIAPHATIAGRYSLSAYMTKDPLTANYCQLNGDSDGKLSGDVSSLGLSDCTPVVTAVLDTTMVSAFLGFTISGGTSVTISDLKVRTR